MAFATFRGFRKIAAGAALIATALLTCGWVFNFDDRQPSHSARIGTLSVELPEGKGTGTAFMVNECGILTNFHVVFGPWFVTVLHPPSHDVAGTFTLAEVTLPDGTHPTARATPVVWGDYLGPDRQVRVPENDWAYLVLEPCLGKRYGFFDLRYGYPDQPARGFTAIGYSEGRQMTDPRCAARSDATLGGKALLHDCTVLPGDSGGPIFRSGTLTIVALASGFRASAGGKNCLAADPKPLDYPLLRLGVGCANTAVPLTDAMRTELGYADTAVSVQRVLTALGYDPGPIGTIESPLAAAAIRQAERDLGWAPTGVPTDGLLAVLCLRLPWGQESGAPLRPL